MNHSVQYGLLPNVDAFNQYGNQLIEKPIKYRLNN